MKHVLKWTIVAAGAGIASAFAFQAVPRGRRKLRNALGQAEAVADRTRAALEETETALRNACTAI